MLAESSFYECTLAPGEVLALRHAAGWECDCLGGRVWLTEEGGEDVWLRAGERCALRQGGLTLLEAAQTATLRLRRRPSPWRQGFGRIWARMAAHWQGDRGHRLLWPPALPH